MDQDLLKRLADITQTLAISIDELMRHSIDADNDTLRVSRSKLWELKGDAKKAHDILTEVWPHVLKKSEG